MGCSIKSLAATANQPDAPSVLHGDTVWLETIDATGLFVEGRSKNQESTHQTQPIVSGAGGRD